MDPSPKEIARLCREIQATWTEAERLQRIGVFDREPDYVPEVVSTVGLPEVVREWVGKDV